MVQKVPFTSATGNTMTIGTGTSRVIMGADSGNLKIQDSQSNTSIIEAGSGIVGASAVSVVANPAALPFSPISSAGSMAFASSTNSLYISNGSGWYKVSLVNTAPSVSLSSATATPTLENLTLDFTYTVTEPEGTPTTVTLANSGIATTGNVAITHTTSNTHIRLVFDGTTEYSEDATVTLSVTDGVSTGTGTITISTNYVTTVKNKYQDVTLLKGLTTAPTTSQKSLYFGTNSNNYLLNYGDESALEFGTNSWTIEAWIYSTGTMSNAGIFSRGASGSFWHSLHMTSASTIKYVLSNGAGQEWNFTSSGSQIPTNTWTHVALVRRFGTDIKLYVNGTAIKTDTTSVSTTLGDSTGDFKIGFERFQGSGGGFNGYISNFRFVNGTAVYTGNFTTPTSPLTSVTNTVILHHGLTNEVTGGVGNPTNTSVTVNSLSPFIPIANNTTIDDASDSNHTVTWTGNWKSYGGYSPYRSTGYSYYNTISSNYVTTETHADFTMGTGDYTVDMWVYRTGESTNEQGIFQIHPSAPSTDYQNSIGLGYKHSDTDSLPGYYLYGATDQVIHKSGSTPLLAIRDQTWTHIAVTRTSGVQKLFIDGVEHVSRSDTKNYTTNHRICIGTYYNTSSYIWRGYIAGFRVIKGTSLYSASFVPNRTAPDPTLTNTKFYFPYTGMISRDYHGKTLTKASVNGDNQIRPKTPYDGVAYDVTKHAGSLQFTASENLSVPSSSDFGFGTGDFTIEGWLILNQSYASSNRYLFDFGSNGVRIQLYNNTLYAIVGSTQLTTTADGLAQHCWFHWVMVRYSGTLKLYINGIERASASDTTNISAQILYIGRYGGSTADAYKVKGYMTDFRVVKGTAVYTGAFTPPSGPLTKTGGTYPSTTNVNTSITSGHTKLLLNFDDAQITDTAQTGTIYTTGDVVATLDNAKHSSQAVLYFDGSGNDYIMTDSNQPQFSNAMLVTDFTLEFYVRIAGANAANNSQRIFDNRHGSGGFVFYYATSTGKIHLYHPGDSGADTSFDVSQNTWYHIAIVRHNFYYRIYKDGVEMHSDGNSSSIDAYYATIGKDYSSSSTSYLNGYVYNLRYSGGDGYQGQNGARYPWQPEAKTLTTSNSTRSGVTVSGSNTKLLTGHAATVVDGSSVGATLTNNGSVTVESTIVPATGMKSLSFNGTNQHLTTPTNTTNYQIGTGQFTAEAWIYIQHNPGALADGVIMSFGTSSANKLLFYLTAGGTTGQLGVYDYVGSAFVTGWPAAYPNNTVLAPYQWIHVAVCRDGSNNMRVFANGNLLHKSAITTNFDNDHIWIGRRSSGSTMYFKGYISNARFVKGQSLYTDTFTPPTGPLDG